MAGFNQIIKLELSGKSNMQRLSEKIKVMLENGDDHILWMNFKFEAIINEYGTTRLQYFNDVQGFNCYIDFPPNDKYHVRFYSHTKYGYVISQKLHESVDQAWLEALKEFRTQTMLTQCNMVVAADHLVEVCNHFLKSDEDFNDLIIPERN